MPASYTAGSKPHLTVSVTNTGKVACKRDIGQAAMGLIIMTGSTRVWSSDDCSPGGQAAVNTLKPGQVFSSTVVWNRTSSKPGCPSGQPAAAPGTYTLTARNLTLKSTPVTFVLHCRCAETAPCRHVAGWVPGPQALRPARRHCGGGRSAAATGAATRLPRVTGTEATWRRCTSRAPSPARR